MRLTLVRQLVLLLVAAVLLAVTALGAGVAWNLRAGFSDYLRSLDEAWLDRFAAAAQAAVERSGIAAISGRPGALRALFDSAGGVAADEPPPPVAALPPGGARPPRDRSTPHDGPIPGNGGPPSRPRPPPPPGRDGAFEGGGPPPPRDVAPWAAPDPRPRPPPPPQHRYAQRLHIVAASGELLSGRLPPPGVAVVERPLVVRGHTVALARLAAAAPAAEGVDAAFLARQYRGIVAAAALLAVLAAAGAVWVGRRWARPVRDAQLAARRIAQGAFDVRVVSRRSDELGDLVDDINAMAASLQQLESTRRRWIAELSHEMRTPLAVLRGEVECLVDGIRRPDVAALASLQAEVLRLARLVDDFHQLALSDLRALPCTPAPVHPARLAGDAVGRVTQRAAAAGLAIECDTAGAPVLAQWDRVRIDQLLSNLLENSLRYTDAGGRVVLVVAAADGNAAVITVDDGAPGVPAADLPRLFDPLYRADPSRSRASGGSGLGLAICRAIVQGHGGRIEAQASALGGLRVVATLPVLPSAAGMQR